MKELKRIRNIVCQVVELHPAWFCYKSRKTSIVLARHFYHYFCMEMKLDIDKVIKLSKRDRTSVYYSYNTISDWLENDKDIQSKEKSIRNRLTELKILNQNN